MSIAHDPSRAHKGNGAPRVENESPFVFNAPNPLLFIGADKSPRRHASCNAAVARIDAKGINDAKLAVFSYAFDHLSNLPAGQVPFHDLQPARAAQVAAQRVLDTCLLAAPLEAVDEYRRRLAQLSALREGRMSAHQREITTAVEEAVAAAVEPVVRALVAMADDNPLALEKVCESGRKHIADMIYSEDSLERASQLVRIRDALAMVAGPTSPVPSHKRETLRQLLLAAGHEAIRHELAGWAGYLAERRFRQRMAQLAEELRDRAQFSRACREHLEAALRLLQDRRDANSRLFSDTDATGEIFLPGPTADAVLNSIARELQCSRAEMMDQLREAYLRKLANESRDLVEEGRSPLPALATLDPQASVFIVDEVVQPYLGRFSVYQAAKEYGPARLASELYSCAEPLLHLNRESGLLNVELTPVTIVELPHAATNDDAAVRIELQRAFERHPPINVRETQSAMEIVQIVRSLAGYSAALLADNDSLAVAYVESRRLEHRPHLFGFLRDTPDGFASPIVIEILRELEQQESQDAGTPFDSK